MRIALDARTVYWPTRRGTGKNLVDLYTHVAKARPNWQINAFHRLDESLPDVLPFSNIHPQQIEMRGDRFNNWERLRLPYAAWRGEADVLHCPANTCPSWMPIKTLVTIHDLIPLDSGVSTPQTRYFHQCVVHACGHAAGIITPSLYTRNRLVRQFNADPHRITVNPWAPDSQTNYISETEAAPVLDRYAIDQPYVLHFGAAAKRKNTCRVIEAWAMLNPRLRKRWQLVVIGLDDKTLDQAKNQVACLGITEHVNLNGFADEADLPALLSSAKILAFTSLSEGFGLPILDAWKTQTAVLTSDVTSLPEVAGDTAELVDPFDTGTIASGLTRLMKDRFYRQQCIAKGLDRLQNYTWEATTQRYLQAVEKAVEQKISLRQAA